MSLAALLPRSPFTPAAQGVARALQGHAVEKRVRALDGAKPFVFASLWQELRAPVLALVARPHQARWLHEQLLAWCGPAAPIYLYPEPDGLPYERIIPDPAAVFQRLRALHALSTPPGGGPPLVVASAIGAAPKTLERSAFRAARRELKVGESIGVEALVSHLLQVGYTLEAAVELPGTASRRGGIVDVFPPAHDLPARIEFAGRSVQSIRLFDPATQLSTSAVESVEIIPARELLPGGTTAASAEQLLRSLDTSQCTPEAAASLREELEGALRGQPSWSQGLLNALGPHGCLLEYLPADGLLVLDQPRQVGAALEEWDAKGQELKGGQVQRGELPAAVPAPYFPWPELCQRMPARRLVFDPWGFDAEGPALSAVEGPGGPERLPFSAAPAFAGRLSEALAAVKSMVQQKEAVVIVTQQAQRLSELLLEQDVVAFPQSQPSAWPAPGGLLLVQGLLDQGWVLPAGAQGALLTLLTDAEVFGISKQRRARARRPVKREEFLSDLNEGDYVVHVDHGIGRFAGVVRRAVDGVARDYLLLEYAGADRLYVPVEQVDRIGPYVAPRGQPPSLARLGSQEWQRTKQRVKESARLLARELLELYAAREVLSGHSFSPDAPWQQELEAAFPYAETADQLQAIAEVKADMEEPRPMDRLICGDVGYGKTEVAVRAAFKAVMEGFQVAVLVPTTVLAQQHFVTFSQRLRPFPVQVAVLSRFLSDREQEAVVGDLASGAVDIVIGTHRLLQKDVRFKNLGLVIIDEEQRFGVAHKERLKQMRKEVDVLTLSATPIPRTLYMALAGIRDMSTMATPPEERLPISTYAGELDERIVREAVLRELERGGQVFFVHNRVKSIEAMAERLRRLVPEAKVAVAHGQMDEDALEQVMGDFAVGQGDVLLCTTIIESGLDMANVNTLIVNEADKLGLSQLYQLRGRVGRGSNRAYAYFLFDRYRPLTEAAEKRLKTILAATELGSGFKIAMKDMEIRGAGNILGPEQSGNIAAVGFDLYTRLLSDAVEEGKARMEGRPPPPPRTDAPGVTIDLPLPAYIPDDYVPDGAVRLALYQRLVRVRSPEEVNHFLAELKDRFGDPPPAVHALLSVVRVKMLAAQAGATSLAQEDSQVVVRFQERLPLLAHKLSLERKFGRRVSVGQTQLRLAMTAGWEPLLLEVLGHLAPEGAAVASS